MFVYRAGLDTQLSADSLGNHSARHKHKTFTLTIAQRLEGCAIFLQLRRQNVACHGATRPLHASATIAGRARRGGRSVSMSRECHQTDTQKQRSYIERYGATRVPPGTEQERRGREEVGFMLTSGYPPCTTAFWPLACQTASTPSPRRRTGPVESMLILHSNHVPSVGPFLAIALPLTRTF